LKKISEQPEYSEFYGVIKAMLTEKARLEQEVFLL
jgi:hypothetical protein